MKRGATKSSARNFNNRAVIKGRQPFAAFIYEKLRTPSNPATCERYTARERSQQTARVNNRRGKSAHACFEAIFRIFANYTGTEGGTPFTM